MLVADPTYHAECEWFASRACAAVTIEQCDDLIVIVHGCEGTDLSNERKLDRQRCDGGHQPLGNGIVERGCTYPSRTAGSARSPVELHSYPTSLWDRLR